MRTGRRNKTLVYVAGGGRFGNQLVAFSHLIALACEYPELRIVNPNFWLYHKFCAGTASDPLCRFPKTTSSVLGFVPRAVCSLSEASPALVRPFFTGALPSVLQKMVRRDTHFSKFSDRRLPAEEVYARFSSGFNLVAGYNIRVWDLFVKHQAAIRQYLMPAADFQNIAEGFISDLRSRFHPIIGLAMRQTDYRVFEGGRFFIESPRYRVLAEQLIKQYGPKTGIVVTCDEIQADGLFDGLPVVYSTGAMGQQGHYMEAFAQLSMCDMIASVPSSFSCWAAFFGSIPTIVLKPDESIESAQIMEDALIRWHELLARPEAV